MDVRLSSDQRALRDSVTQLVDRLRPAAVRDLDDTERVAKLDAAVAATGWRELRSADDAGGAWASGVEVAIVAEQLARGLADTAYLGPVLAADLRLRPREVKPSRSRPISRIRRGRQAVCSSTLQLR
jgi:alkylation response protein AidB-like acyl-CoA dehydrogenase